MTKKPKNLGDLEVHNSVLGTSSKVEKTMPKPATPLHLTVPSILKCEWCGEFSNPIVIDESWHAYPCENCGSPIILKVGKS